MSLVMPGMLAGLARMSADANREVHIVMTRMSAIMTMMSALVRMSTVIVVITVMSGLLTSTTIIL